MHRTYVIAALILTTGCVGKARYEALKTDYDVLLQEQKQLAGDLTDCKAQKAAPLPAAVEPVDKSLRGPTDNRE